MWFVFHMAKMWKGFHQEFQYDYFPRSWMSKWLPEWKITEIGCIWFGKVYDHFAELYDLQRVKYKDRKFCISVALCCISVGRMQLTCRIYGLLRLCHYTVYGPIITSDTHGASFYTGHLPTILLYLSTEYFDCIYTLYVLYLRLYSHYIFQNGAYLDICIRF